MLNLWHSVVLSKASSVVCLCVCVCTKCVEGKGSSGFDELVVLADGQEANWEVVERILFIYAKLNPGHSYVQVVS